MIFKSPFSNDKHDHGIGSKVDLPIPIPCLSLKAAVVIRGSVETGGILSFGPPAKFMDRCMFAPVIPQLLRELSYPTIGQSDFLGEGKLGKEKNP